MPHSPLLKFTFRYSNDCKTPLVPVRFIGQDGTSTPTINAILDSGADEITIPEPLADYLHLDLEPRDEPISTAGGSREAFKSTISFYLGRGGREVKYENIEICVIDEDMPVLIGITPVFEDYNVTIMAHQNKFILEPKE